MVKLTEYEQNMLDGAEGPALVCPESIQGWAGVSDTTGCIIEEGHPERGSCHLEESSIENTKNSSCNCRLRNCQAGLVVCNRKKI